MVTAISSFSSNPLTTTFTRDDDCSGIHRSGFVSGVDIETSCLPDGFDPEPTAFFSPGLECPAGYVNACHDHTGVESITTITCCPKVEDNTLSCVTASTLEGEFANFFCTWIAPKAETWMPITLSENGVTSTDKATFKSPDGLNAYGVRMVYQSSDLDPAKNTDPAAADEGGVKDGDGDGDDGLPQAGKIAVGVVVPVVAIAFAAAAFLFWRRLRKKRALAGATGVAGRSTELPNESKPPAVWGGYYPEPAPNTHEMPINNALPAELPTPTSPHGRE